MPDLNFTVDGAEQEPHAAAPLLIFKLRIAETVQGQEPTTIPAIALAARFASSPPAGDTLPTSKSDSSTFLASPTAGAKHCGAHLGLTRAWSSLRLPATRSSTFPSLARSTSMSPRPSTFMHWKMARSRSACCSAARSFTRTDDGYLQVSQIPWEKEAYVPAAGVGLERHDGAVLSQ